MNTIGSVYYGWAFLIACGAGSYYFAKRSINADRYERQAAENELRQRRQRQMGGATLATPVSSSVQALKRAQDDPTGKGGDPGADGAADHSFNPSKEAAADPAPTDRSPGNAHVKTENDSPYEAVRPFRSRKGDRFS